MSANVVDSLVISMGLDPAEFMTALNRLRGSIENLAGLLDSFAQGVDEGFRGAAEGAGEVANTATGAADALAEAGSKGGEGLVKVADKAEKAATQVRDLRSEAEKLGQKLGGKLRGLAGIVAPLTGMVAAGSLAKGHMDDLEKLDKYSRKAARSMEERKEKQKLLALYTRQDLELYRESKKGLEAFGKTMKEAAASAMRALLPAVLWLTRGLEKLAKHVREHKPFYIAFFSGLAAVITGLLVPAVWKWTAALLANPLVVFFLAAMAAAAALALVIDDLWTYINGGESALSGLWSMFGKGDQTLVNLSKMFLQTGTAIVGVAGAFLYAKKGLDAFGQGFALLDKIVKKTTIGMIIALIVMAIMLLIQHWDAVKATALGAWDAIREKWDAAGKFFSGLVDDIGKAFDGLMEDLKNLLPDWLKDILGIDGGRGLKAVLSDTLPSMEDVGAGLKSAGNAVAGFFGFGDDSPAAAQAVSPALVSGPVDNSATTTINGGITINTPATDARGIAGDMDGAIRTRMTATGNKGVRQ